MLGCSEVSVWCSPQGAGSYIRRQLRWVWVCWDVVRCLCGAVLRVGGLILDDS